MIFGRKKKSVTTKDDVDEVEEIETDAVDGDETDSADTDADTTDADADSADTDAEDSDSDDAEGEDADESNETDQWREFDLSRDWREEGPFDIEEVDLEDDDATRLDLGALIVTPIPGAEVQLQLAEPSKRIISARMIHGQSALEMSVFAAPRTPGLWAEVREEIAQQTTEAGGDIEFVEGPFGTEVRRQMRVKLPDGQTGIQPSRMWVAEGPRWFLRGVLYGPIALSREWDDDTVGPFYDAFSDLIVRRGPEPRRSGEVLYLEVPEDLKKQAAAQQAEEQRKAAEEKAKAEQTEGPIGEGGVMGVARQGG